ncbi:alpha/beta hydrolase [Tsukamurella strandjordii]|uniref:alpha/beta hydrolase n=1 Tax=Tsukamurella strandjordii TaxID=147577 RepID=UPI0031D4A640
MPQPRTVRPLTVGAALVAVAVAVAGCAPSPAPSPGYVTDFGSGGGGGAPSSSANPVDAAPQWRAPQNDPISWQDCTDQLAARYNAPAAGNATLQCGSLTVALGQSQAPLRVALTRAVVPGTPATAPPLVMVGGTEFTSQRALTTLAAGEAPLLATRPVVAIDRRGLGGSAPLTCRTAEQRSVFRSGGGPADPLDERVAAISRASTEAATLCGDAYPATLTEYTAAGAADDLEALRSAWRVPALALLAVGDGSTTALAYAAKHPKQVARLALDSPVRYSAPEAARAEDAAKGTSATLQALASQCGPACALGPDPAGAIRDVVDRAAAGRLAPFTDTDVRRAVITTLGIGAGDRDARIAALAPALQAARTGDPAPLRAILRTADEALGSDGQFVGRCSDAVQKASPDQAKANAEKWGPQYRLGAASALTLADCTSWPSMPEPPALTPLSVRSLVATAAADPLTSRDALETLNGQLTVAGAQPAAVTWGGIGDGAVVRSACVQNALVAYLDRLEAPSTRACPA